MKDFKKRTLLALVLAIVTALPAVAQELRWKIVDQQTGEGIPFSSAVYRGHHVSAKADSTGYLVIERHEGWTITISAVGYRQKNINIISEEAKVTWNSGSANAMPRMLSTACG